VCVAWIADVDFGHGGRWFCRSLPAHRREEWAFRGQPAKTRYVEPSEAVVFGRLKGVAGCGWMGLAWWGAICVYGERAR
jgi:hypothetical protein